MLGSFRRQATPIAYALILVGSPLVACKKKANEPPRDAAHPNECKDTRSDAENCGQCGHSCGRAPCRESRCEEERLASDVESYAIAVVGDALYFTDRAAQRVARVSTRGGTVTTLAPSPWPYRLSVAGDAVVWSDQSSGGSVRRVSSSGGAVTTLATGGGAPSVASNERAFYWTDRTSITEAPLDGSTPRVIGTGKNIETIAVDAKRIAWAELETQVGSTMHARLLDPRAPVVAVSSSRFSQRPLVFDGDRAYWFDREAGLLEKNLVTGDTQVKRPGRDTYFELAIDASSFYFVTLAGEVQKMPRSGGPVTTLSKQGKGVSSIALDQANVYWATPSERAIWRVEK